MPNTLAYLMLLAWPLVTVWLFRRLPPGRAVIWAILAGYLLLPPLAQIKISALPGLDKLSTPVISVWLYALLVRRERVRLLPEHPLGKVLAAGLLLSPFVTTLLNSDPIPIGPSMTLPAQGMKDAVGGMIRDVSILLAWALARHYLRDAAALRDLLVAVVLAMLAYSLPMLVEVRLSPQINVWVYGFFQHSFDQMMRQGGFRPIVFLEHALWVALLTLQAALAAITLSRLPEDEAVPGRWRMAAFYLVVVLVLCKSMGSLTYMLVLAPLLSLAGPRSIMRMSLLLVTLAILYPVMQMLHLVPVRQMLEFAASLSADRAQSLGFRFFMEERLLTHALERVWFGWGGWGRNMLYDPLTGNYTTVADGQWIITFGMRGLMGFVFEFGLLCLPVFLLARREVSMVVAGAALMLAINMVDLLPNATLTPITWMLSGALLGYIEELRRAGGPRPAAARVAPLRNPALAEPRTLI